MWHDTAKSALQGVSVVHMGESPDSRRTVLTLPHAAPEYSGHTAALAMVSELSPDKEVLLLGFNHDGSRQDCQDDHSVTRVRSLLEAGGYTVTVRCPRHDPLQGWPEGVEQIVVSTDFSHFNIPRVPPHITLDAICKVDIHQSLTRLTKSPRYHQPCGREVLASIQPWTAGWHTLYYQNSSTDPHHPKGVGYAILRSFHPDDAPAADTPQHWKMQLDSKLLAWGHLQHVCAALRQGQEELPALCWSPLSDHKGSCFVTIYDSERHVLSCMGGWQEKVENLWEALAAAYHAVYHEWWPPRAAGPQGPAAMLRANMSEICITLIAPQKTWKGTSSCQPGLGCRVEGSSTYLSSVWEAIPDPAIFTQKLREKAQLPHGKLQAYDEIKWTLTGVDAST